MEEAKYLAGVKALCRKLNCTEEELVEVAKAVLLYDKLVDKNAKCVMKDAITLRKMPGCYGQKDNKRY